MPLKKKIILLLTCLCLCGLVGALNYFYRYKPVLKEARQLKQEQLRLSYRATMGSYQRFAQRMYQHIISKPGFLDLYRQASSSDKQVQAQVRAELLTMFTPFYTGLKKVDVKQFQFHLPNCESFLRFHRPAKFGDNLSDIRYSVVKANRELTPVTGFEGGGLGNGFRFVFPIISQGKHLGSVEFSWGYEALVYELRRLFNNDYLFMIKRKVTEAKLFESEKGLFKISPISPDYMIAANDQFPPLINGINTVIGKSIKDCLRTEQPFTKLFDYNRGHYQLTFLPITNVAGQQVGYLISYANADVSSSLFRGFIITTFLSLFLIILIFIIYYVTSTKNTKLQKIAKQAEDAALAKTTFLANMSHEIRTPMNGILGMGRILQGMEFDEKGQKVLDNLMTSALNLLGLLNDILDFSKIEAGQLSLEKRSFSLSTMVDHVISTMSYMATEKQLFLVDKSDYANLPVWIMGDELRLRQILINLVNNAIKFTETGGITITVQQIAANDNKIKLKFEIADSGIGISESKLEDIFTDFTQAEASTSRMYGGTGLGLAISEKLVQMMDGEIGCTSKLGVGSLFFFSVILDKGTEMIAVKNEQFSSCHNNLHVLLVEDNKVNQIIATEFIENDNHQVMVAENGMEALNLLVNHHFDVIFMDVQMPRMDGLLATTIIRGCEEGRGWEDGRGAGDPIEKDLAARLKKRLNGCHIPIIAMTANAMDEDRKNCLHAGMDDYLTKPFMLEDIYAALNRLDLTTSCREIESKPVGAKKAEKALNQRQLVTDYLKQTYSMDDNAIDKMFAHASVSLTEFQKKLPQAVIDGDSESLHSIGHSIKGIFLNLGLDSIAAIAKNIENAAAQGNKVDQQDVDDLIQMVGEFIQQITPDVRL